MCKFVVLLAAVGADFVGPVSACLHTFQPSSFGGCWITTKRYTTRTNPMTCALVPSTPG